MHLTLRMFVQHFWVLSNWQQCNPLNHCVFVKCQQLIIRNRSYESIYWQAQLKLENDWYISYEVTLRWMFTYIYDTPPFFFKHFLITWPALNKLLPMFWSQVPKQHITSGSYLSSTADCSFPHETKTWILRHALSQGNKTCYNLEYKCPIVYICINWQAKLVKKAKANLVISYLKYKTLTICQVK